MSIIKHIKEIDFTLTNGVTRPVRARLDDNTEIIAKLFNNEQGNLTLVNELVSYRLALLLNLPTVKSGVCACTSDTLISNNTVDSRNYGPCFYSSYLQKSAPLKIGIIRLLKNIDDFYKLLLFDHIIYNKDRNIFNLLATYTKENIQFKLIDHSHVFKNETIWDASCFHQGIHDFDINDTCILSSNDALYSMFYHSMNFEKELLYSNIEMFQTKITEEKVKELLKDIPAEWDVSHSNLDALAEYILYRTRNSEILCDIICNYLEK